MPSVRVSREHFERLVGDAIDSLPDEFRRAMDNVRIVVEGRAVGRHLFGLYEGIPLTKRTGYGFGIAPDKITIYQDEISDASSNEQELAARVKKTVLHEVAHHFGISDPRLDELGWG